MAQRQIIINAYPLVECGPHSFAISFDIGQKCPSKRFGADTVADCKAALAVFAKELEPSGKSWHLSVSFDKHSGRKPAGFDKANTARELQYHVNPHLAKQRAA
jgi:hypothetical protein